LNLYYSLKHLEVKQSVHFHDMSLPLIAGYASKG